MMPFSVSVDIKCGTSAQRFPTATYGLGTSQEVVSLSSFILLPLACQCQSVTELAVQPEAYRKNQSRISLEPKL